MKLFDAVTGGAPLVDLAGRAVSALEGAASALGRIAHNAELIGAAMHVASQQAQPPRHGGVVVCSECDEVGRLRCSAHGPDAPRAWTDRPPVRAHIDVGCDVKPPDAPSYDTAWCATHNVHIPLS